VESQLARYDGWRIPRGTLLWRVNSIWPDKYHPISCDRSPVSFPRMHGSTILSCRIDGGIFRDTLGAILHGLISANGMAIPHNTTDMAVIPMLMQWITFNWQVLQEYRHLLQSYTLLHWPHIFGADGMRAPWVDYERMCSPLLLACITRGQYRQKHRWLCQVVWKRQLPPSDPARPILLLSVHLDSLPLRASIEPPTNHHIIYYGGAA
jgi:hypothetical protein